MVLTQLSGTELVRMVLTELSVNKVVLFTFLSKELFIIGELYCWEDSFKSSTSLVFIISVLYDFGLFLMQWRLYFDQFNFFFG